MSNISVNEAKEFKERLEYVKSVIEQDELSEHFDENDLERLEDYLFELDGLVEYPGDGYRRLYDFTYSVWEEVVSGIELKIYHIRRESEEQ